MALSASTILFFIISCGLWIVEGRTFNSILTVPNGGKKGDWGPVQFCPKGFAFAFRTKEEVYGTAYDLTGLNAVALECEEGTKITSTVGPWGLWQNQLHCPTGKLVAFALRVEKEVKGDNTAANSILFLCSDNTVLVGSGIYKGRFDQMSNRCKSGYICGIQTRVQTPQVDSDDTALNDVKMYCCD